MAQEIKQQEASEDKGKEEKLIGEKAEEEFYFLSKGELNRFIGEIKNAWFEEDGSPLP